MGNTVRKRTVITNQMAAEMTQLRDLGVPVAKIARKFGIREDTVRFHTSEADREKQRLREKERYEKFKTDPVFLAKRRGVAKEAARQRRIKARKRKPTDEQ